MPVPDDTPSPAPKLRVTIVGHASPRWRGATNDVDADLRNERLANQRADQVFLIVERLLRSRLGQDVQIEKNVTIAPGGELPDLVLTARGDGSREAREEGHKPRSSDDDYDRRVEVGIDLVAFRDLKVGRSLPSEQAKTKQCFGEGFTSGTTPTARSTGRTSLTSRSNAARARACSSSSRPRALRFPPPTFCVWTSSSPPGAAA
jgi:hypothetical protein